MKVMGRKVGIKNKCNFNRMIEIEIVKESWSSIYWLVKEGNDGVRKS